MDTNSPPLAETQATTIEAERQTATKIVSALAPKLDEIIKLLREIANRLPDRESIL